MKATIKKLWLNALRSGEYKQGKGTLRANDSYCCLGVLCDLHAKEFKKDWVLVPTVNDEHYDYLGRTQFLPNEVSNWAEIDYYKSLGYTNSGMFKNDDGKDSSLSTLNDEGKSFTEIADIIEKRF